MGDTNDIERLRAELGQADADMAEAREVLGARPDETLPEAAARVTLDERERCAQVAEAQAGRSVLHSEAWNKGMARIISAAIRSGEG